MTVTLGSQSSSTEMVGPRPETLAPRALLELLCDYLERAGGSILRPQPGHAGRSYELLELTDAVEIWAIHWPKDEGLELHDHGGSAGALWVVEGVLHEHSLRPDRALTQRTLTEGGGIAFGAGYIHDVVNPYDAAATSVHAYSPPMESMTFYRIDDHTAGRPHDHTDGRTGDATRGLRLVAEHTEYRADPAWCP